MKKNLTNHFLIAPPDMSDPRFEKTVIYLARHDDKGAFGFVINKPLATSFLAICTELSIHVNKKYNQLHQNTQVLDSGPVMPDIGFVLHSGIPSWHSSVAVTENVCFTSSKDVIEAIAQNNSVGHYLFCLGHAGWQPNQLEQEINQGGWFVTPANLNILFNVPFAERWHKAGIQAGINFSWLAETVGNA